MPGIDGVIFQVVEEVIVCCDIHCDTPAVHV